MLKVKTAQKGRSKNDVKHSTWIQRFFNFLSSQIKSDDIPLKMGKANVLKCEHKFCLNCFTACFLSGKNEE